MRSMDRVLFLSVLKQTAVRSDLARGSFDKGSGSCLIDIATNKIAQVPVPLIKIYSLNDEKRSKVSFIDKIFIYFSHSTRP